MKIIAPLAVIFGALATAIGLIIAAMKIWEITTKAMEAVQAAFNVVMDANPIVLIIIAVVALVAAIVLLWKHSETFRDVVIAVWNAIKVAAEAVWNAIKVVITVVIDAIVLYVKTYIFVIKTVFEAVWTAVKWVVSTAIDFVKATIQAGVAAVLGIWHGIVKIVDFVKEAFDKVKKAVGDVVSFFENLGHDIIHGIWTGITKAAGWLADKFKGLAKTVAGPFAKVLGISSPSKLFAEYGLEIVRGLAGGMDSNAPIAVAAATRLASGLAPTPAGPAGGGGNVLPALAGAPASVSIVQNIDGALDPAVVGRVASNEIAWALRTTRS
jgi:phage-related protein